MTPLSTSKDQKAPPHSSSDHHDDHRRHRSSNSDLDELSTSPTGLYSPMIQGVNLDSLPSSTASTPAVMTSSSSGAAHLQLKPRRTVNSKLHHILHKDSQHSLNQQHQHQHQHQHHNHHHINSFFDEWSRSHSSLGNFGTTSPNVSAVSMSSSTASNNNTSTITAASARIPKASRSVNGLPHLNSHRGGSGDSPVINSPLSASPTPLQSPVTPASPFHGSAPNVKETHYINIDYDPVSGRKMLNKYEVIRELGRGQHGKVKLGKNMETGEYVAIKIVDRTSRPRLGRQNNTTQEDKIRREVAILKKCNHPNIVRLLEVLDDSTSKKIYLVLEYLEKGEVTWQAEDGVPAMSRKEAKSSARDVLLGLEYLHYQGIIHRDIKPANLLLSGDGKVKISDFGVSYASSPDTVDEYELAKTAGTPAFFAPELCMTSADTRPTITSKIDIWAFGVTLFCLIYGKVPFMAESEFELFKVIASQELEFPDEKEDEEEEGDTEKKSNVNIPSMFYNPNESKSTASVQETRKVSTPAPVQVVAAKETDADLELAKDLLRQLLEKNPDKRISLPEIKKHPWICDGLDKNELECFLKGPEDGPIEISPDEVRHAVQGITGKIKRGLSRFGSTALQLAGLRRRKSSASSASSRAWSASTSRSSSREPANKSQANTAASSVAKHSPPSHEYHSRPRYHSMVADLQHDSSRPHSSMSSFAPASHPHTFPRKGIPSSSSNLNLNAYLEQRVKDLNLDTAGIDDEMDYFDGHTASSSSALKSLNEHIIEEAEPRGRLDLNPARTAFSRLSTSSQESDSDSDGDNGELTLVLGPSSRAVSQSPNNRLLGRSSSLMQHGIRTMTPPTSSSSSSAATARHTAAAHGSLRLGKTSRSTLQAEIDSDNDKKTKNNDNDNTTSSTDSLSSRHRSRSVTVAMIQRPSYME